MEPSETATSELPETLLLSPHPLRAFLLEVPWTDLLDRFWLPKGLVTDETSPPTILGYAEVLERQKRSSKFPWNRPVPAPPLFSTARELALTVQQESTYYSEKPLESVASLFSSVLSTKRKVPGVLLNGTINAVNRALDGKLKQVEREGQNQVTKGEADAWAVCITCLAPIVIDFNDRAVKTAKERSILNDTPEQLLYEAIDTARHLYVLGTQELVNCRSIIERLIRRCIISGEDTRREQETTFIFNDIGHAVETFRTLTRSRHTSSTIFTLTETRAILFCLANTRISGPPAILSQDHSNIWLGFSFTKCQTKQAAKSSAENPDEETYNVLRWDNYSVVDLRDYLNSGDVTGEEPLRVINDILVRNVSFPVLGTRMKPWLSDKA